MNFEDKLKMFNVDKSKDIPATRPRNKTYNNPQNKNLQNNIINNPSSSVSNQIKKDVASNIISQDESYDNKLKMFQTSSNKNDNPIRAKPRTKTEPPKHKTNEQTVGNAGYVKSGYLDSMTLTEDRNTDVKLTENAFKNRQNMFSQVNKNSQTGQNFIFKDDKNKTDSKENSTYVKSTKQDSMSLTGDKNQEIKLSGNAFKDRMIMFTEKPKEPPFIKKKTNEKISDSNSMNNKNPDIAIEVVKSFEDIYDKFPIPVNKKKLPKKKEFVF